MSFLGKLMGKKDPYMAMEDEPATGYDPAASEHKVNSFLGSGNPNDNHSFDEPVGDNGLPPDSMDNHYANDNVEHQYADPYASNTTQQSQSTNNTSQNPYAPKPAQMPSGVTGQEMASRYIQEQQPRQQGQISNNDIAHREEVLNLKLDSMKNQLDAINQRIQKIEQLLQHNNKRW